MTPAAMDALPCPWCGSTRGPVSQEGSTYRWRTVECAECGAGPGEIRAKADPLTAWNTRATPPTSDALSKAVEAVRAMDAASLAWNADPTNTALAIQLQDAQHDAKRASIAAVRALGVRGEAE